MRIVELTSLEALENLREPWGALAARAAHDTPYLLPEYLLPWVRRLDGRWRIRFLAAWQDERLVGLAPLMERRIGRAGVALGMVSFPEVAPSPPCDVLVEADDRGVEATMLAHLLGRPDWDAIELANAPLASVALARIKAGAEAASLGLREAEDDGIYEVRIHGAWDDYLASRTKKMRQNLRRGWRHFERLGATRVSRYPDDMPLDAAIGHVLQVLRRSWKDDDGGAQGWNRFTQDIVEEFDRARCLELSFLMVADVPVAFLMDVPYRDNVFAVHNAYDLRHQLGNPGQLLLSCSIERAHGRGAGAYVMGPRDYLRHWTSDRRPMQRLRVQSRAPWSRLKLSAYDWVHERRIHAALAAAERAKDARKHDVSQSSPEDEP